MKTAIPAPPDYHLIRVDAESATHYTVPVIAFLIDDEAPDDAPAVVTATGDTLDDDFDGLVLPDGRVRAAGYEYRNARAYIEDRKGVAKSRSAVALKLTDEELA